MTEADAPADSATRSDLSDALQLNAVEARVLACLIEKEATTPDQYPLTEHALTQACNQKTSREPVMDLSSGEVGQALRRLEPRQLVRSQHAARAQRWEHRFAAAYGLTAPQQAVLCTLMLRGPQTISEILVRSERIVRFADAAQVRQALDRLAQREPALATQLPRQPGQREERWGHLLCGPIEAATLPPVVAHSQVRESDTSGFDALEARIAALESRLEHLEQRLAPLPLLQQD